MKATLLILLILMPLCGSTVGTFDSSAEGWTALTANSTVSGYPVGNPLVPIVWDAAGFTRVADVDNLDTFFAAPPSFLGPRLTAVNTVLRFDLFAFGEPDYAAALVVARGDGLTLTYTAPSQTLVQNTWVTHSVTVAPSSNWRIDSLTGAAATRADFATVFGNLTALWISAENVGGIVETTGLDNVRLDDNGGPTAVPEPGSMLLSAAGTALLAWTRRSA